MRGQALHLSYSDAAQCLLMITDGIDPRPVLDMKFSHPPANIRYNCYHVEDIDIEFASFHWAGFGKYLKVLSKLDSFCGD